MRDEAEKPTNKDSDTKRRVSSTMGWDIEGLDKKEPKPLEIVKTGNGDEVEVLFPTSLTIMSNKKVGYGVSEKRKFPSAEAAQEAIRDLGKQADELERSNS